MRKLDGRVVTEADLSSIVRWQKTYDAPVEIPYHPARVLMQDFTGVPAVVDLARHARRGQGPGRGSRTGQSPGPHGTGRGSLHPGGLFRHRRRPGKKCALEYERNSERYELLKWAQKSFSNFKVVPPNSGICHQVNLENLGRVVITQDESGHSTAYPDTVVGTDSHTPMINGIGVMGWGRGRHRSRSRHARPALLPVHSRSDRRQADRPPQRGRHRHGSGSDDHSNAAPDQCRREICRIFRSRDEKPLGHRPGHHCQHDTGVRRHPRFFSGRREDLDYLKLTGRDDRARLVEAYTRATGMFYTGETDPEFTQVVELDLSTVQPSLAGPARPQDRISLPDLKKTLPTSSAASTTAMPKSNTYRNSTMNRGPKAFVPGAAARWPSVSSTWNSTAGR